MVPINNVRADLGNAGLTVLAPADPVRTFVRVALALYLTPVVAVVCTIGGLFIALDKISGAGRRLTSRATRDGKFRLDSAGRSDPRMTLVRRRDRQRTQVGR